MRGCYCRAAEGHTRECRDCHCLDRLVHVTPTFPGFLPLHKVRHIALKFLTRIFERQGRRGPRSISNEPGKRLTPAISHVIHQPEKPILAYEGELSRRVPADGFFKDIIDVASFRKR